MPKTAPQFFRFKSKEIASRRRQNKNGPQLTTNETGQPFTFKTTVRDRANRPAMKPSIYGPYKKRAKPKNPALLEPVTEVPSLREIEEPETSGKSWVNAKTTGRITDLAIASAKIIFAGLCGSALINTVKN